MLRLSLFKSSLWVVFAVPVVKVAIINLIFIMINVKIGLEVAIQNLVNDTNRVKINTTTKNIKTLEPLKTPRIKGLIYFEI